MQDFSYASIFLVCSIAGKNNLQWVAAGDTAQMISPGCSFTFDGMKQTIRAIREDVKLRKVEQLKRNYRMTKGVLDVANDVLKKLKQYYPGAIESAKPEISMKDLGLRVVLLDWKENLSFSEPVRFGAQQAMIYSSPTGQRQSQLEKSLQAWLGNHPFILTSLESKGTWPCFKHRVSNLNVSNMISVFQDLNSMM